jgi:pteridine reductase
VAVVTGSGKRRVGRHVAEALAADGFAVAVHYHTSRADAEELVRTFRSNGTPAAAFAADLADEGQVDRFAEAVFAEFGQADVLVNCAAIWERKRLEDTSASDVRRHFEANTLGTFLCCRRFGLAMAGRPEGGCVVNVGDWADVRPYPDYPAYFPSKAAIPGMTRMFAVELGTRNPRVRVNAILPGPVLLPPDLPADERRAAIEATLAKREGRPEDVVRAVRFFVASEFVTGVCLPVDGGRSVYANGS